MVADLLEFNKEFVRKGAYRRFISSKYPKKKLAILSCMDTRLVELLPAALGLHNGDVKLIKNAGGMITGPYDTSVRSLLIAILELGVEEVMVIGHTDCGVSAITPELIYTHLKEHGIPQEAFDQLKHEGFDFELWFKGFDTPEAEVSRSVSLLKNHPLIPETILISGYVMNVETGYLKPVC